MAEPAVSRLLSFLEERDKAQQGAGPLSLVAADVVVSVGLPKEQAERALVHIAKDLRSHLSVTDQGELLYHFEPGLLRRDAKTTLEKAMRLLSPIGKALWRGFAVAFKVWIAATLVVYTTVFALLALALSVASEDDGPGLLFWWLLPDWFPGNRGELEDAPKKRFHRSVFDYVFGPNPAKAELTEGSDRQLLALIRDKQGRITAGELALALGIPYSKAEEEATRLLATYDGEPEVNEDGVLIYTFKELRKTAFPASSKLDQLPAAQAPLALAPSAELSQEIAALQISPEAQPGALEPVIPAYVERQRLTGNGAGINTAITVFNGFNLLAATTLGPWAALVFDLSPLWTALLTVVPLTFSLLFFAVPIARALVKRVRHRGRRRRNVRRAVLHAIAQSQGHPKSKEALLRDARDELLASAVLHADEDILHKPTGHGTLLKEELDHLHKELDGDVAMPQEGDDLPERVEQVLYTFPRLAQELGAVRSARDEASNDERSPGAIVFSSAEELP